MMEDDDFTLGMMEYPFYYKGMTLEEWKKERQYMAEHLDDVKKGTYRPLWKQKENVS